MQLTIIGLLAGFIIGLFVFCCYQLVLLLKNLASEDRFFTAVNEPEVKIILEGGDPVEAISNVDGYVLVYRETCKGKKEDWTLVETTNWEQRDNDQTFAWLKDYTTFEHVSIFGYFFYTIFPNKSIAEFKIDAARWKEDAKDFRSSIEHTGGKKIQALRGKTERRMLLKDIEIGGGSGASIDVIFEVILILVHPLVAGFDRAGNFYEIIDAAIEEVVTREALKLGDDNLFETSGDSTKAQIFDPKTIMAEIETNKAVEASGYKITKVIYRGFDFSPSSAELVKEKREARQAEFKRQQAVKAAEAEQTLIEKRGLGKQASIRGQIKEMTDLGVDPNLAAHIYGRTTVAESIAGKDSSITTFIEQGAGSTVPMPTIEVNRKEEEK